jgi:hypothetical protein
MMIGGLSEAIDRNWAESEFDLNACFMGLVRQGTPFSADNVYFCGMRKGVYAEFLGKIVPLLFKRYRAAGYIKRTGKCIKSKRSGNSSHVLPLWIATKEGKAGADVTYKGNTKAKTSNAKATKMAMNCTDKPWFVD